MPFLTEEKRYKTLRQTKQHETERLFLNKQWSLGGLKTLIRNIDDPRKVDQRLVLNNRPRIARLGQR